MSRPSTSSSKTSSLTWSAVMRRSSRSGRADSEHIEAARRQAALALGRDPDQRDSSIEPPESSSDDSTPTGTPAVAPVTGSHAIGVLSTGEVAARLGMSRSQLEALVDAGKVAALPTGFTRMIPTAEVERLRLKQLA